MTDVGASAGGCRRVAEGTSDCFPNYRHAGHIVSDRARVEGDEREDVRVRVGSIGVRRSVRD